MTKIQHAVTPSWLIDIAIGQLQIGHTHTCIPNLCFYAFSVSQFHSFSCELNANSRRNIFGSLIDSFNKFVDKIGFADIGLARQNNWDEKITTFVQLVVGFSHCRVSILLMVWTLFLYIYKSFIRFKSKLRIIEDIFVVVSPFRHKRRCTVFRFGSSV